MTKENFTRHEIREKALQALFPLDFQKELSKKEAIVQALTLENDELVNEEQTEFVLAYLDTIVAGVCEYQQILDEKIQKYAKNWTVARMSKPDIIILRIAVFEMLYCTEIPNKVALNEALELAKKFSDDNSRKFVNGILSNLMKELD